MKVTDQVIESERLLFLGWDILKSVLKDWDRFQKKERLKNLKRIEASSRASYFRLIEGTLCQKNCLTHVFGRIKEEFLERLCLG